MNAKLEIDQVSEGLRIRSTRSRSIPYALLSAVATGAFVFFIARPHMAWPLLISVTTLSAALGSVHWLRTLKVELRVTKFEMQTIGNYGVGYTPNRHIPLADVQRLEYRPESGDEFELPGGLYVEHRWKADCVLPHLNESQTQKAIDTIYERFPFIPIPFEQDQRDIFGRDLITLDLTSRDETPRERFHQD